MAIRSYIILFLLIQSVLAIPQFNTGTLALHFLEISFVLNVFLVNGNYNNGTTCPPATRKHVACPILCVKDQNECPTNYGPSACRTGTTLCIDGSCQSVCTGQQTSNNKCGSCPARPGVSLKSCFTGTPLYVDIPNYKPENATAQLYEVCSNAMGSSAVVRSTWNDETSPFWNVCSAPKGINFPIKGTAHLFSCEL